MKNKSPAFRFYPGDYLSSLRVSVMTLEQQGAYMRLLCHCWIHGSIPSDPLQLAALLGNGGTPTLAVIVSEMFDPHPDDPDVLINDRLEAEREKQAEYRNAGAVSGRHGGGNPNFKKGKPNPYYQDKGRDKGGDKGELSLEDNGSHKPSDKGEDKREDKLSVSVSASASVKNTERGGAEAPAPSVSNSPEAEPATKTPSPDAPQAPVPAQKRPVKPEMAIWQAKASSSHPDWPVNDIQAAWEYYESVGWRTKSGPIVKWEMCVNTCYRTWKQRQSAPGYSPRSPFAKPVEPIRIPDNLRPGFISTPDL